jgi:UDP-N-acetylglucosamine--N-acetylmuramyl-(pentapeptide) pyrophosphoryl-undecaprenol N-acetylglucosamine transferase
MVPLPGAIDQDQAANASLIDEAGGGWMVAQSELTPQRLAAMLADFIATPGKLSEAAAKARALGRPDGAEKLADVVERAVSESRQGGLRGAAA